jgi:two-component system, OmpR family, osmolarity sensor histidine kinase EnvZ
MKWLPDSLAARTVWLVIAVIAVTESATFSLVGHYRRASHMDQTVQLVSGQVRLLQTVLPGLDPAARRALAASETGEQDLQLRPDGAGVPTQTPQFGFAHRLGDAVSERLGEAVALRHAGPGRHSALWIGFLAGGERWWLVLPRPRFEPQELPPELWGGLAATLAAVLLIAGLFVRGIVGPLARLGEAVAATGDGAARTVTPAGPQEVRRLAERHNTMLEQLDYARRERSEMLAGLTHDLRAPLARLRVRLALLENESEQAGLARDAEDMERIVGQCLAFLRGEESPVQPAAPLLLADAVSNEVARHRELGRPVAMAVDDSAVACQVAIAPGSLQRLLDNLIDNALQYGAPPVEVALAVERAGTVTLRVRDHGPGIAAAQRDRALEPFAQIDPARATGGSCGLGLAIVRRIVAGCGGEVALEDAADGGLAVVLRLPTV